jgi:hypothetical protein
MTMVLLLTVASMAISMIVLVVITMLLLPTHRLWGRCGVSPQMGVRRNAAGS